MKFLITIWTICILTYIYNIVIVCIKGATLFNNICGWACCICWLGCLMFCEIRWNKERDRYSKDITKLIFGDLLEKDKEEKDD